MKYLSFLFVLCLPFLADAQYPASLDLRLSGLVTPVKDQGLTCGSCWAFATCASIESSLLMQGAPIYDLSEDNITDCHGFDETPCFGGSYYMANALLSRHGGPLTEFDDPYTTTIGDCPNSLPFPPLPPVYIEDMTFIPGTVNDIKDALTNHGAVASTMYFTMANYNATSYKYYDSFLDPWDYNNSHCVTIVGWDDNMTFPGAPSPGGWIIKDSFGTAWADNGYFYCSYSDAGILTENVIFPIKQDIPPIQNQSHVYYHDYYGWVDNHSFGSTDGYALVKYTIQPFSGSNFNQQIKRIGTYAVEDNMTITAELYRTKIGNTLSDLITTATINPQFKGYYTIPFDLKTEPAGTDIYIKVHYSSISGTTSPIPVEKYELNHTTAFSPSNNTCWVSANGATWNLTGVGTTNMFDPCIKMYTQTAPLSIMDPLPTAACRNDQLFLNAQSIPFDSVEWLENGNVFSTVPGDFYFCMNTGNVEISLVTWLGALSDTTSYTVQVNEIPNPPTITQTGNTLSVGTHFAYQWLDQFYNPIPGETNPTFNPPISGIYSIMVYNANNCFEVAAPFNYTSTGGCNGDADVSGVVDILDLLSVSSNFGCTSGCYGNGDANFDGVVNIVDLLTVSSNFGIVCP